MSFRLSMFFAVIFALTLSGCDQVKDNMIKTMSSFQASSPFQTTPTKTKQVVSTKIGTPNASIRAEDGSFKLTSNQVTTPFRSKCDDLMSTSRDMVDSYTQAEKLGAKRVRVSVSGRTLYGILMFCDVDESATGAASRVHLIEIPDEYIEKASAGRISVVYSLVDSVRTRKDYGWILWLSDSIIPR